MSAEQLMDAALAPPDDERLEMAEALAASLRPAGRRSTSPGGR
jgi:hypothetical protein